MNKYEIYVNKTSLYHYIKENYIEDKRIFSKSGDFEYVGEFDSEINFFDRDHNLINGWSESSFLDNVCKFGKEVTPKEFLIAIGYIEKEKPIEIPEIKAEDIHYLCEDPFGRSRGDSLTIDYSFELVKISVKEYESRSEIFISPEGLIELGSDLVKLGVQLRDAE